MKQGVAGHVMQLKTIFKMKLKDFLVMIGLKLLITGYLENTLRYTTPFNNSENSVMTQVLIYLSTRGLIHEVFDVKGFNIFRSRFLSIEKRFTHTRSKIHLNSHWKKLGFSLANGLRCKQSYRRKKVPHFASRIFVCKIR